MLALAGFSVFKTTKLIESIRRSKMDGDFSIFYRLFSGFQGQPRQSDKKVLIFVKYRKKQYVDTRPKVFQSHRLRDD